MDKKNSIKLIVAIGIGTALFVVLTTVAIPLGFVPNTALQPRMAVLAFFSAIFGPAAGAAIGFIGHALGDALFYGSVWWSWVIPEAVVGLGIGAFFKVFKVEEGGFTTKKNIVLFNFVQMAVNAIAWIGLAPALDIIIYAEPAAKVFLQGVFAWLGNVIIIAILGTILLSVYSSIAGKTSSLKKED